ncbi:Tim44 domain-containing protein [Pigmentiphaga sp. H8]|uniref:Tim44 domain-containing protein n=1 Tax=unclassified Pigmentiphaga TaxID=2626614 RepID=UPI000F5A7A33|nr:TIM44-like domain-containing protein [Pigmentiphaga sp. H8]AZG07034.1 Tim44 domain-containing protein [Pigmentiphaga sp. H8]
MSRRFFSRFIPALVIAVSTVAMLGVSHDALAKRLGGGGSMGRQSSNLTQRQATPPARTPQQNQQAAPSAAPAAAGAAAGATAARSGMSRWLGPIAGIAAGLGLAALLSHLGLGAAAAELIGSLLLIALAVFAVLFIVRRLRGVGQQPALQGAGNSRFQQRNEPPATMARESAAPAAAPAASVAAAGPAPTGEWGIPSDFDTANFLSHAKNYFVQLQGVWDRGDVNELRDLVTDDLLAELSQQIGQREGQNVTEVVLLNAELLGIETVSDGHLASVRFSGMLREAPGTEAFRFEEVWNLFKPNDGGWLLAGVQQIPVQEHNR